MRRIAAALLTVVVVLAWNEEVRAFGCAASGSFPMFPSSGTSCGTPLHVGDVFDVDIHVTNTSGSVPAGTAVTAKLVNTCAFPGSNYGAECALPAECDSGTCNAALFGTLACTHTACATELPGVLTFVPVGANGCVTSAAGVAACLPSPMDVNRYEIRVDAGGVPLAAGATAPLATIRVMVTAPVPPPEDSCGRFGSRVDSSGNSIVTTDAQCDAPATGGAAGSVNLFLPAPSATPTPAPTPACGTAPASGCRRPTVPLRSRVLLRDRVPDTRDRLKWRWLHGAATSPADFGDPLTVTGYAFCVYDQRSGTPSLTLTADIPAGGTCGSRPCWSTKKRGFTYVDKEATPHGVVRLELRAGAEGEAEITLEASGAGVLIPALPLVQDPSVVVQLRNDDGVCWEASYGAPAIRNEEAEFLDRSD